MPRVKGCPNCGQQPSVRHRLFHGMRAECRCGVSGPFVAFSAEPERDALDAWAKVAGEPDPLPMPPPAPRKR